MIKNGEIADALDIEKIIVSNLQSINQNTILSAKDAVTDKSYTYASSDTFSDSNGYNNTIASKDNWVYYDLDSNNEMKLSSLSDYSGASDYYVIVEATSLSSAIDNVNNCYSSQISSGTWIVYCTTGTAEVKRAQIFKTLFYGTNGSNPKISTFTSVTAIKTSDSNDVGYKAQLILWSVKIGAVTSRGSRTATFSDTSGNYVSSWSYVSGGGEASGLKYSYFQMPSGTTLNFAQAISDETGLDKSADEQSNPASMKIMSENTNMASGFTGVVRAIVLYKSGTITWGSFTQDAGTPTEASFSTNDFSGITLSALEGDEFATLGTITTSSKTFNSNVKSILVNANKVLNGDSTITVDVSSDGGSTWDVTEQALDTIIELDGDDNDIVIKFNLNVDGNTPELYGYSYQVFT